MYGLEILAASAYLPVIPKEGETVAAYGYVRVSSVDQAEGTSLEEQARVIRGAALMKGLELTRVFEEPGVSGSVALDERAAGRELVALLQPGDWLLVAKLDRAFRSAADALTLADTWKRQGVKLVVADMGADPVTDNGVAKLFFGMLACVAEFERDRIRQRTADGRRAKLERGGFIGGRAPFGYRVEGDGKQAALVPVEVEQDAILTVRTLRRSGATLQATARAVRERHGVDLSPEMVRRIAAR